jgi:hypothetical protein
MAQNNLIVGTYLHLDNYSLNTILFYYNLHQMLTILFAQLSAQTTKATYYFSDGSSHPGCAPVQTFNDGQRYGPCVGDDGQPGVLYGASSKYWAAVANGREHCGKNIRMCYGSSCIKLVVKDSCPGCDDGHVDFGLEALVELTGSDEHACAINRLQPQVTWGFDGDFSSNEVQSSEKKQEDNSAKEKVPEKPKVLEVKVNDAVHTNEDNSAKANFLKKPEVLEVKVNDAVHTYAKENAPEKPKVAQGKVYNFITPKYRKLPTKSKKSKKNKKKTGKNKSKLLRSNSKKFR